MTQTLPASDTPHRRKILIFTDSRGQHKPRGATHDLFAERLAKNPLFEVRTYLCPMKWTTTLDFLERFPATTLAQFDHVILYTGIVDWSPRKWSNARDDLYDNIAASNLENFDKNTAFFSKKVVNSKKAIFDRIFGVEANARHFSKPFETVYDGEQTINMYGLDEMVSKLSPVLAAIPNLIFITSNRFVPGWQGDYTKGRPENIGITETYSRAMRDALPADRVIDLLQWDERAVTEFTCDNLHLSKEGSDWIYEALLARMAALEAPKTPAPPPASLDRSGDLDALRAYLTRAGNTDASAEFLTARSKTPRRLKNGMPSDHVDQRYIDTMSFLFDDESCAEIIRANAQVKSDFDMSILTAELYASQKRAADYIADRFALFRKRWQAEYQLLTLNKLAIFPYNYISGYSYRALERSTPPEPVTVDFIWCIKNRRQRTAISANSLIRSFRAYQASGDGAVTVRLVIVEDVSVEIFDPSVLDSPSILDHYIVDTGLGWTRSGLLNVGIKNSTADLVALVDADFLFHEGYVQALADYLATCDWRKQIIASNLIETEAHRKGKAAYSAASPYSYMWMVPKDALHHVQGFDEGYNGHGSEDRDLELKLLRLCGLTVADTASIVPDCAVLHLSHNARDGYDQHETNRKRYQERLALEDPESLRQAAWGEQDTLWAARTLGNLAAQDRALALFSPLAPRRFGTEPLRFVARQNSADRTLYMVVSSATETGRQALLDRHFKASLGPGDSYVFVVGGALRNWYDVKARTLYLSVGDTFEDLAEKVLLAIAYCTANFDFAHLVKVDDDVIVNFALTRRLVAECGADYFGQVTPAPLGTKPDHHAHRGLVTERSPYFDQPFTFAGGPAQWCRGECYVLSRDAAEQISAAAAEVVPMNYLYDDYMVACLLDQRGIKPALIDDHGALKSLTLVQSDLRGVMDASFSTIANKAAADAAGGVHCGACAPHYELSAATVLALMEVFINHYPAPSGELIGGAG